MPSVWFLISLLSHCIISLCHAPSFSILTANHSGQRRRNKQNNWVGESNKKLLLPIISNYCCSSIQLHSNHSSWRKFSLQRNFKSTWRLIRIYAFLKKTIHILLKVKTRCHRWKSQSFLGRWGPGMGSRYVVRYPREIFTLRVENEPVNMGRGRRT